MGANRVESAKTHNYRRVRGARGAVRGPFHPRALIRKALAQSHFAGACLLAGCVASTGAGGSATASASAVLHDAAGRELGTLRLSNTTGGIQVSGQLRGLPPGPHGIHVHSVGRCEPTFDAAGGHWNPTGRQHGIMNPEGAHFGDLPNVTVAADSTVEVNVTTRSGTLRGSNGLLDEDGAAIVVHAGPDDYRTDPAGGSGARIACGAITAR